MIATQKKYRTISPRQMQALKDQGHSIQLIDVRTPAEFGEVHVQYARNVPLDRLSPQEILDEMNGSEQPLYVICRGGNRSKRACERLFAAGGTNIVNVEGGTQACISADLPVVRGDKTVSLERQVRVVLAIGGIVGVAGYFLSRWFLVFPVMVGIGILHSGIADICMMGGS